jgi:hypothetical protein
MEVVIDKIQIKRGLRSDLPTLDVGEPAYCLDTGELAIGTRTGNQVINKPYDPSSIFAALQRKSDIGHTHPEYALASALESLQKQLNDALARIAILEGNTPSGLIPINGTSTFSITGRAILKGNTSISSGASVTINALVVPPAGLVSINGTSTLFITGRTILKGTANSNGVSSLTINAVVVTTPGGNNVLWTYDFVIPAATGTYNLNSIAAWNHTLTTADVYGANLDGLNQKMKLLTLGVQDGTPNEPGQELPRDGFDTFAGSFNARGFPI